MSGKESSVPYPTAPRADRRRLAGVIVLAALHLAGPLTILLPFTWSVSPLIVYKEIMQGMFWRGGMTTDEWHIFALAFPFLLVIVVWGGAARAISASAWRWFERCLVLIASIAAFVSMLVVLIMLVPYFRGTTSSSTYEWITLGLSALGVLVLGPGRWAVWRWRPLHPAIAQLLWLRAGFVMNTVVALAAFPDYWQSGAWLALAVAALYTAEATLFIIGGKRGPHGIVGKRYLRFWLPRWDCELSPDGTRPCTHCGYDLRGTLAIGLATCPECGRAADESA